jgi:heavy metal sensor kinase
MLNSVRVRLTLWYAGALALALLAFALAAYLLVARLARQRADAELADAANQFITTLQAESSEGDEPGNQAHALEETLRQVRFRNLGFQLFTGSHQLAATSDNAAAPVAPAATDSAYQTSHEGGPARRTLTRSLKYAGEHYWLVAIRPLADQEELLRRLRVSLGLAALVILLCASFGGYYLAYKSLQPVARMTETTAQISATNLHERLPVAQERDELGRLAQVFNGLLARLEAAFAQQRRFMADASHELRTPLAIICGEAEVTLARPARKETEYREALALALDEGRRMTRLVEDLLTLARADAGHYAVRRENLYLDEVVTQCARAVRTLAAERNIAVQCTAMEELPFCGDETLLRRLFLNLLDNALKYTPQGGEVTIVCQREGDAYVVTIADTGAGIPAEAQPHIFERFYRADPARARESLAGGSGLGLAIAKFIAEAHQGSLALVQADAGGSIFKAHFPLPKNLPR